MYSLAALVVLVGVAAAAPQAVYKPAYKPVAAPYKAAAYPYATAGYPYPAPAYPYSAPAAYPYSAPAYPYSAPAAYPYARPSVYSAPVAKPFVAPVKPYAGPAYAAAPYNPQYVKPIAIVRQSQDDNFDGSFTYDFEAENGISSQASGFVKNAGSEAEAQVIQGRYSYISPEGIPITTTYYADENGVHIEGDHLPVAPPVPDAIAKSLAYQASLPAPAPAPFAPAVYKKP